MPKPIRVAFFTDAFDEPNGVASLSREFVCYSKRHGLPMLVVRGSKQNRLEDDGCVRTLELKRCMASFRLDQDLYCDPLFVRHLSKTTEVFQEFAPDVVHITGPGDMGIFGARVAHLNRVPLVASWHTNLHEYAARRVEKGLSFLPCSAVHWLAERAEQYSLKALLRFYRMARMTMAPNSELVGMIGASTRKPCLPMLHGVDLERFRPCRKQNGPHEFTIGYVGRLTPEKNVRRIAEIEAALEKAGAWNYRFVLVGDGSERGWLRERMHRADFPGVLREDSLANAFANMDVFLFPSETDTFGLVILEAMASGVPVVVARGGGPQYQVDEGVTGFVADDTVEFAAALSKLKDDPKMQARMGVKAREHACENSWNRVFDQVHAAYDRHLF